MAHMELTARNLGEVIFDVMVGNGRTSHFKHWEAIRPQAEPLVRQLLALVKVLPEMEGIQVKYEITDYYDENGKYILSRLNRIRAAQKQLWGERVADLREGDRVFIWDAVKPLHSEGMFAL